MATTDSSTTPSHQSGTGPAAGRGKWLVGAALITSIAYVGVIRPAHDYLSRLQVQADELAAIVEQLNKKTASAERTISLMEVLVAQGERIYEAENALERITALRNKLVRRARCRRSGSGCVATIQATLFIKGPDSGLSVSARR